MHIRTHPFALSIPIIIIILKEVHTWIKESLPTISLGEVYVRARAAAIFIEGGAMSLSKCQHQPYNIVIKSSNQAANDTGLYGQVPII